MEVTDDLTHNTDRIARVIMIESMYGKNMTTGTKKDRGSDQWALKGPLSNGSSSCQPPHAKNVSKDKTSWLLAPPPALLHRAS